MENTQQTDTATAPRGSGKSKTVIQARYRGALLGSYNSSEEAEAAIEAARKAEEADLERYRP